MDTDDCKYQLYKVKAGATSVTGEYKNGLPTGVKEEYITRYDTVFFDWEVLADPDGNKVSLKGTSPWSYYAKEGNFVFFRRYKTQRATSSGRVTEWEKTLFVVVNE